MPRAYTDAERQAIVAALRREALACMKTYGVRKTTVDELVRRVNIPKGTFYLFYSSKESLLFDAVQEIHDEIQDQVVQSLAALTMPPDPEAVTDVIYGFYLRAEEMGLAAMMAHGDLDLVVRALPDKALLGPLEKDHLSLDQLTAILPGAAEKDMAPFEGAFRAIFLSLLYRREIGDENFHASIRLLTRGLVDQLLR